MNKASSGGLSTNKPLQTNVAPPPPFAMQQQQQQQIQLQSLAPAKPLPTFDSMNMMNNYVPSMAPRKAMQTDFQQPAPPPMAPNKPLTTNYPSYQPPMQQAASFGMAPSKPLTTNFQPPMQQSASFGMAPSKPLTTNFQPPMQQSAAFGMAPSKPLTTNFQPPQSASFGMAPGKPLTTDAPMYPPSSMMQQPAFPGMAPGKPLTTMPISSNSNYAGPPTIAPNRPLMTSNFAAPASLAPNKMRQTTEPSLAPNKLMSVSNIATFKINPNKPMKMQNAREPRIATNKPLTTNLIDDDDADDEIQNEFNNYLGAFSNSDNTDIFTTDDMLIDSDPGHLKPMEPLSSRIDDFLIDRPEQINNLQQTRAASNVAEAEPMVIDKTVVSKFEEIYMDDRKINPPESILPTNVIDDEISQLKELYNAGFVMHSEYEERMCKLLAAKKHSTVITIPHTDLSAHSTRRVEFSTSTKKNRNIRIFISSTFRDMGDEREMIVKRTLPKLRELCNSRGIQVTAVDLRWGITTEQTKSGNTINICLSEIDRCRPYFVSMLGSRYGWAQPLSGPKDVLLERTHETAAQQSQFLWIKKFSDRSITELEIRHAVLNNAQSDTASRALFYMKKGDARDDDPRLTALKEEIHQNSSLKTLFYDKVEAFSDQLYTNLAEIIEMDFPLKDMPSNLEKERMSHEAFQDSRARVYIGRQYYFDTINAHLAKSDVPFIVVGNSGSGKSAFVANWTAQYKETHPSDLVVAHYIGSSAASTDLGRMLRRIMQEIDHFYDLKKEKEIPQDFKEIVDSFPQWLRMAGQRGGIVLVLDALNQLDASNNSHDLNWLPTVLNANVKLVVSTLPGKCQQALEKRNWKSMEIQPLSISERSNLIVEYLAIHGKKLGEDQLLRIVNSPQCDNPLFLRTLLEEIRMFGSFEHLDSKLDLYLRAQNPPELFSIVFARLENDFPDANLVANFLCCLWVSRKGLTESEILDILGIPHSVWSPFYLSLSEFVVSKSGYLGFFHDYMRQAVEMRYLRNENKYPTYRAKLINYFSKPDATPERKYEEVPYLLEANNQSYELCTFITNLTSFNALFDTQKFDLYRYWRAAANHNPSRLLITAIENSQKSKLENFSKASQFLQDIGYYNEAEECARKALQEAQQQPTTKGKTVLVDKWQQLAYILRLRGKYAEAAELYEKALEENQRNPDVDQQAFATSMNSLAILYRMQGKYEKAEPLYTQALQLRKKLFGEIHPDIAQSYNSLGCLNQDMGRYPVSENFLKEAIRQRELLCGAHHPDVAMSLNNLGGLYIDWSKYTQAEPIYQRAMLIYQTIFGYVHPYVAKSINNLAGLFQEQGKYAQAEEMYLKCVDLRRKLLGNDHPELALSLNDLAVLYARQDKYPEAEKLYKEALEIRKRSLGESHPDYAQSLKNMASLYQDLRRYDEALRLFQEGLRITTTVFGEKHQDVATSLTCLGGCYQMMQQFDNAIPLYERALKIQQELVGTNHGDVALTLNDMAVLYFRKRDNVKAEELYLKALKTYENVFGLQHPNSGQASLNVAQFYRGTGSLEKARKFYTQAYDIFVSQFGEAHTRTQGVSNEMSQF